VPEPAHAEGGREVEEAVPVRIPDIHALRALPENRKSSARKVTFRDSWRRSCSASARERGPGMLVISSGSMAGSLRR
jgi:hypothetical protein